MIQNNTSFEQMVIQSYKTLNCISLKGKHNSSNNINKLRNLDKTWFLLEWDEVKCKNWRKGWHLDEIMAFKGIAFVFLRGRRVFELLKWVGWNLISPPFYFFSRRCSLPRWVNGLFFLVPIHGQLIPYN